MCCYLTRFKIIFVVLMINILSFTCCQGSNGKKRNQHPQPAFLAEVTFYYMTLWYFVQPLGSLSQCFLIAWQWSAEQSFSLQKWSFCIKHREEWYLEKAHQCKEESEGNISNSIRYEYEYEIISITEWERSLGGVSNLQLPRDHLCSLLISRLLHGFIFLYIQTPFFITSRIPVGTPTLPSE